MKLSWEIQKRIYIYICIYDSIVYILPAADILIQELADNVETEDTQISKK